MKRMTGRRIAVILGFALAGGLAGFFGAGAIDAMLDRSGPGDSYAGLNPWLLFLGGVFVVMGVAIAAASLSRRAVAASMAIDLSEEGDVAPERRLLRLQGVLFAIAGAAMILPGLGSEPLGLPGETAFAVVVAILVVESVINWRVWRSSDELMRRIMGEACAVAFWAFQLVLFIWAIGAHFGVIARFDALDVVAAMMAIYLVAAGVVGARRGQVAC